ncbi:helix-turn-helix domain-containing protein [Haloarcula sp. JP-L23]|uniref:helix-turn-helix domain-containing protein n=1 Tax=Haloarcula sp. JP-L23 TaxID=2716717 RepID=UPI00140ECAB1|nr:helix-turn-helix domain-containing protein [Haloarcula sp. JP-L23]
MREAILHLSDSQLAAAGLKNLIETVRAAGFRDVTELVCHGPGGIILLQVEEPLPETDLDDFDAIVWWERLATSSSGVTYLCKVSAPDLAEDFPIHEHGVAHDVSDVCEGGLEFSVIGSQADIGQTVSTAGEAGLNVLLERLTDYRGPTSYLDALTDRQREIVQTAYSMGYYDVPREASTDDVAHEVDLDPSTVAEHLQRAEHNLLSQLFQRTGHPV